MSEPEHYLHEWISQASREFSEGISVEREKALGLAARLNCGVAEFWLDALRVRFEVSPLIPAGNIYSFPSEDAYELFKDRELGNDKTD